jgi:hypothetical protein
MNSFLESLKATGNALTNSFNSVSLNPNMFNKQSEMFRREYAEENAVLNPNMVINNSMLNRTNNRNNNPNNAIPIAVLPNNNILLKNGNIVDGEQLGIITANANANSSVVKNLPNGNIQLKNGNTVNRVNGNTVAVPVAVNNSNVILSNGNTVANKNISKVPNYTPNNTNVQMINNTPNVMPLANNYQNANRISENINAANSGCPIAPPSQARNYCTPAPFSGTGKYFYVQDAYGHPAAI